MLTSPLLLSHRAMADARTSGRAVPLTDAITEFMRLGGDWWTMSPDGWLRVTDTRLAGCLTDIRARLDHADEEQACAHSQAGFKEEER